MSITYETPTSRKYAWGLQTDYKTPKTLASNALRKIILMDENFMDYDTQSGNDEGWSHGFNYPTEEWLEGHENRVQHTMPGHSQEMGRVFYLNLGNYGVTTPAGGTATRDHSFKPQDPDVSRQSPAVTYAEKVGSGWDVLMPSVVGTGFSLKGDGRGILTLDFGLEGSGKIINPSGVNWGTHVAQPVGLYKFFNTQMSLVADDGEEPLDYAARYRSFVLNFNRTMNREAGLAPADEEYQLDGDPDSGAVLSALPFDSEGLDYTFNVVMAAGSPELTLVQEQKPLNVVLKATGGIIEAALRHELEITIPVTKYTTSKPVTIGRLVGLAVSGRALFDFATSKLFEIRLRNNVATYASGW